MTPMPFVVGAPRSGTTLLRMMLDRGRQVAIPPETGFLLGFGARDVAGPDDLLDRIVGFPPDAPAWQDFAIDASELQRALRALRPFDFAEGLRTFYRLYAARFDKTRYGDKTPAYAEHLERIEATFPEACFVHLIRDGRDVAVSWREQWFAPGRGIVTLAERWREIVGRTRELGAARRRYLEVRFEQLIVRPEATLRTLCAALELEFDPAMCAPAAHASERLAEHLERRNADGTILVSAERRWAQQASTRATLDRGKIAIHRQQLHADERRAFEAVAGDLLRELGYATGD